MPTKTHLDAICNDNRDKPEMNVHSKSATPQTATDQMRPKCLKWPLWLTRLTAFARFRIFQRCRTSSPAGAAATGPVTGQNRKSVWKLYIYIHMCIEIKCALFFNSICICRLWQFPWTHKRQFIHVGVWSWERDDKLRWINSVFFSPFSENGKSYKIIHP